MIVPMLRNRSKNAVQWRLSASLAAILVLAAASSGFTIWRMMALQGRTDRISRDAQELSGTVSGLDSAIDQMAVAQRTMLTRGFSRDATGVDAAREKFQQAASEARQFLAKLKSHTLPPHNEHWHGSIEQALEAWIAVFPQIDRLCKRGNAAEANRVGLTRTGSLQSQARAGTSALRRLPREMQAALLAEVGSASGNLLWMSLFAGGLTLLAGALALVQVTSISRSLLRISMVVSGTAGQLEQAAQQISSASQSLAHGASEQAATIEQTSASSSEILSMAGANTGKTRSVSSLMGEMDSQISDANHALKEMVVSMGDINSSSDKIARIIKVIDEIAFQTNLLALNAAVEAARAGEAGMGFAVVAEEVRSLAHRSAQAAKDTEQLIQDSIQSSKQGKSRLDQVASVIRTLTGASSRMRTLIEEVNSGSEEQVRGIDQISQAVTLMDSVTRNVAAQAEQTASCGQQIASLGSTLQHGLLQLQQLVGSALEPGHGPKAIAAAVEEKAPRGSAILPAAPALKRKAASRRAQPPPPRRDFKLMPESAIPLEGDFKAF